MSLRARLLITTVALVAAGLAVAGVATHRFLSSFLVDRVDEELVQAREPAFRALQGGTGGPFDGRGPGFGSGLGGPSLPLGTYAAVLDPSGTIIVSDVFGFPGQEEPVLELPSGLPGSAAGPVGRGRVLTVESEGFGRYRVLATDLGPLGTLVVAVPLSSIEATLGRLIAVEVLVGAGVLGLVAALALWLVRVGLRPLEGIGETAGAIAAGDLSRRVDPADERTEVGRLGLALNSMLGQIEEAFEERRASEARLRRFVADASHELRTPLTSIRGYSELFRRGAEDRPEDLAKSMQRIEEEAGRMGILVDDLLLLARLDQGRPLERDPVDLGRVAASAVEGARAIDPDRTVDLRVDGPAGVLGDEDRLRQVVDNLLDNARAHTPPGTPVHMEVGGADGEVVLRVADEGPGFPPEDADRLFERFYRGDPSRSRARGGTGLGLSIVAAIVAAHGGTVSATAADGAGAVFEVRLPAAPPPSTESGPATP